MYTHSLDSNSTDVSDMTQQWAIRGQMGDILSGHFSALAFLAVALSVFLQNEANRQIRDDMKKQEERSFIANINVKFDRYYKMFDSQVERIVSTNVVSDYISSKKIMATSASVEFNIQYNFNRSCNEIDTLLQIINAIHRDIRNLQNTYPQASQNFLSELKLKALCTRALHDIRTHYKEPSISGCIFFTEFFKV
jgi:hypothetical protein